MAKFLAAIFVLVSLSSVSSASNFKESRDTRLAEPPMETTTQNVILILSDSDKQRIFPNPDEKIRTRETTLAPDKSCFTAFGQTYCRLKKKRKNVIKCSGCGRKKTRTKHHEKMGYREEDYSEETKNESRPLRREDGVRRHAHRRRHRHHHEKSRSYDRHGYPYDKTGEHINRHGIMNESGLAMPGEHHPPNEMMRRKQHERTRDWVDQRMRRHNHHKMRDWSDQRTPEHHHGMKDGSDHEDEFHIMMDKLKDKEIDSPEWAVVIP